MFIPWDEWVADPERRALTREVVLARALYWYKASKHQIKEDPASFDWLESLAECCSSLEELLPDPETDDSHFVTVALLNAVKDLQTGLLPEWMKPAEYPPSRRPPSMKEQQLRGVMVDSVRGLQQLFEFEERRACKAVVDRLGSRTDASAEAVRGWARSKQYEKFSDLVANAGEYDFEKGSTEAWLRATARAYDMIAQYPSAVPKSR
jgi:hypothetical protein